MAPSPLAPPSCSGHRSRAGAASSRYYRRSTPSTAPCGPRGTSPGAPREPAPGAARARSQTARWKQGLLERMSIEWEGQSSVPPTGALTACWPTCIAPAAAPSLVRRAKAAAAGAPLDRRKLRRLSPSLEFGNVRRWARCQPSSKRSPCPLHGGDRPGPSPARAMQMGPTPVNAASPC